jgi:hypothetical protein
MRRFLAATILQLKRVVCFVFGHRHVTGSIGTVGVTVCLRCRHLTPRKSRRTVRSATSSDAWPRIRPPEHWDHLRTSNPIESVFATVRHRTVRTKGALSAKTAKLMVFKLVNAAAKTWRRLNGENQLPKVVQGIKSKWNRGHRNARSHAA